MFSPDGSGPHVALFPSKSRAKRASDRPALAPSQRLGVRAERCRPAKSLWIGREGDISRAERLVPGLAWVSQLDGPRVNPSRKKRIPGTSARKDPLVDEVRRIRAEVSKAYDHDVAKVCDHLREVEAKHGGKVVHKRGKRSSA